MVPTPISPANETQTTDVANRLPFEVPPRPKSEGAAPHRLPRWRVFVAALLNPSGVRPDDIAFIPWILALTISGTAFGLFFLQTGLDRLQVGTLDLVGVAVMGVVGLLYGTLGVLILALFAWIILLVAGSRTKPQDVVRGFALAYSTTLVALILGLVAHMLLGWRTAVAFGVAGVLWALGPMNSALRRMAAGKTVLSLILASICGAALLLGWALLGGVP